MKTYAFTAAVKPASDNGVGERHTPSNPTRVGQFKSASMMAIIICTFLTGCGGMQVQSRYGGFSFGGARRGNGGGGGGGRVPSLPISQVVQIETECGNNPRTIESRIRSLGYGVNVTGCPGHFNYNWYALGGGNGGYAGGYGGGNYQPPNYQPPGCYQPNYYRQPSGGSPSPWYGGDGGFRYVYADPETEYRHQNNIHIGPGARNYGR